MQGMSIRDKRVLQRVDEVCATAHVTRAEMLYALLRGIIAECLPDASMPTVEPQAPDGGTRAARAEASIRKVMRERRRETVRRLKAATHSTKISVQVWDAALASLVKGGALRIDVSPKGKRTVVLLKEDQQP